MKISIIILSFNNYQETTGTCLKMLTSDPDFLRWEVIVVDNASDSLTQQELSKARQLYPHVTFIFNQSNLGFSAGNNVGIRATTGELIVLLNSDAFPSPGMIGRLAEHFKSSAAWGMLGPVTNSAGNEQCIYTRSDEMEGKIAEGLQYAQNGPRVALEVYRLDFFCVAIPREVVDKVGLLDEDFGRGYFEDFDYSLRVKKAGYRLGVVEDAFVYHRGSISFGKVNPATKALIKRNKRLIFSKYGRQVVMQHTRLANMSILEQYLGRKIIGETVPEFRVANRLQYAKTNLPRSWFKRWRYLRSVATVEKNFYSDRVAV
jgi:GT2 family glycosyltransferase